MWLRLEHNVLRDPHGVLGIGGPNPVFVGSRQNFHTALASTATGPWVGTASCFHCQKQSFADVAALQEARISLKQSVDATSTTTTGTTILSSPLFLFLDSNAILEILNHGGGRLMETLGDALSLLKGPERVFLVLVDVITEELDGLKDRLNR